jgi:hypothetical protein
MFGSRARRTPDRRAVGGGMVRAGAATLGDGTARPLAGQGGQRGYTQWTSTLVTLASSMVPLALATVQTWAGLVGWVLTRTW